jgi:hypothetical protein
MKIFAETQHHYGEHIALQINYLLYILFKLVTTKAALHSEDP